MRRYLIGVWNENGKNTTKFGKDGVKLVYDDSMKRIIAVAWDYKRTVKCTSVYLASRYTKEMIEMDREKLAEYLKNNCTKVQ